jgi:hypothetical protein
MSELYHAKAKINERDIDLVLTEDQLLEGISAALKNSDFICKQNPGACWPIEKPQACGVWKRIFGLCNCKDQ